MLPVLCNMDTRLQFCAGLIFSVIITGMFTFERNRVMAQRNHYEKELVQLNKRLEEANKQLIKSNEDLTTALGEKENFILRFSHEIRNPLNSLLGNVDLLTETVTQEKCLEMLQDAKVCGEILLQLLNNVLDTAKVDSHQLEVSIGVFSIREFMEKMWTVCAEIVRKKNLTGTLSLAKSIPEYLEFDKHRLMQIMINMISNATKFTDKGYVKIYTEFIPGEEIEDAQMKPRHLIRAGASMSDFGVLNGGEYPNPREFDERENLKFDSLTVVSKKFSKVSNDPATQKGERKPETPGYLRIEIIDSGCGMTREQTNSLFKKFGQVNAESQKRQIGTGLGLWITKELVEIMEGEIEVYSALNHGTCFVIMIKSHSRSPVPEIERSSAELARFQGFSKKNLNCMIVEDIPYNQEINRKFLEKCGIQNIFIVSNGKEAFDLFKSKPQGFFSFLLMDLDMPILDGKTACQIIRNHEREMAWKPCKIIILTAYSEANTKDQLLDPNGSYKANCFLSKPASFDTILKSLIDLGLLVGVEDEQSLVTEQKKKKVLIAEDDMFNLDMMQKMLSTLGLECLIATNGVEALKVFELNHDEIQLILMDCEMPLMNGFEATREATKKMNGKSAIRKVPIIGLSGHSGSTYEAKAKESGMEMLLTKPISISQLRSLFKSENILD